ncbi:MAG TPA: thiamine pyrophosphate-dependent enzyme [Hyphomicrobiaceae bacterium]|nr:thiamine pyrophosphate-dependent enzyme [Hyphomicrobiaceae bacterium]
MKRRNGALVVPGLGSPIWDLMDAGDSPEFAYSWGGMGLAVPAALGLALAQPSRRVLAMTGDGEIMMGIGSLAVVADQAPKNLAILVLDNESFSETGKQRGLTGSHTDLITVAKGFGIRETRLVTEAGDVSTLADFLFKSDGPVLAVAKVAITSDPFKLPEKDGAAIAKRFRVALGLDKP